MSEMIDKENVWVGTNGKIGMLFLHTRATKLGRTLRGEVITHRDDSPAMLGRTEKEWFNDIGYAREWADEVELAMKTAYINDKAFHAAWARYIASLKEEQ